MQRLLTDSTGFSIRSWLLSTAVYFRSPKYLASPFWPPQNHYFWLGRWWIMETIFHAILWGCSHRSITANWIRERLLPEGFSRSAVSRLQRGNTTFLPFLSGVVALPLNSASAQTLAENSWCRLRFPLALTDGWAAQHKTDILSSALRLPSQGVPNRDHENSLQTPPLKAGFMPRGVQTIWFSTCKHDEGWKGLVGEEVCAVFLPVAWFSEVLDTSFSFLSQKELEIVRVSESQASRSKDPAVLNLVRLKAHGYNFCA